jgi:hypothetical protein
VRYVNYGVGVKEVHWFAGPPDALIRLQGFPAPLEESATIRQPALRLAHRELSGLLRNQAS